MDFWSRIWLGLAAAFLLAAGLMEPAASQTSYIRNTKHNLSKNGPGTTKSDKETEVCVFCHTPHGANKNLPGPLWNRSAGSSTYTRYTSSSLDANFDGNYSDQPGGSSLLCLSCHDGTVALGSVNVQAGKQNVKVSGLDNTKMPGGAYGETSGYTRLLGTDLSNDHPISITYNKTLADRDGEMAAMTLSQKDDATGGKIIGVRSKGYKPLFPLEPTGTNGAGQVQCATCHDPHKTSEKFLRANRRQLTAPDGTAFNQNKDIICLACHTKAGEAWSESAHANESVADETYNAGAAALRDFPGTPKVWQVACLNCHDTHTASGARRLLREGVGGTWSTVTLAGNTVRYQPGTTTRPLDTVSAIENTCYQCHTTSGNTILTSNTGRVPDIESEFDPTVRTRRMPLRTSDQGSSTGRTKEAHDIVDANFTESAENLGYANSANRHVECTDCHNPHRVRRAAKFYAKSSDTTHGAKRTHDVGGVDGNVASGVLRGAWGVEPKFGAISASTFWPKAPTFDSTTIRKGDPGPYPANPDATAAAAFIAKSRPYLTREYQLCFKCHSNYSNGDLPANFPLLGNSLGGTPSSTNGLTRYTNVAAEFGTVMATDTPSTGTDQGERGNTAGTGSTLCGGDCEPGATNHRSWHPVMFPTGRNRNERGSSSWNNLRPPYKLADVGTLTMHCSDCHGSEVSWTQGSSLTDSTNGPNTSNTQGPHGSSKNFLLKGIWDDTVTPNAAADGNSTGSICGRCHDPANATSGFNGSNTEAGHDWSPKARRYCMFCHIAIPHGWKNKAFLVNLNCVQSEAGAKYTGDTATNSCMSVDANNQDFNAEPYYYKARLKVNSWAKSGSWQESSCGASGGLTGKEWMSAACGY